MDNVLKLRADIELPKQELLTPMSDPIVERIERLQAQSGHRATFDGSEYRKLEQRLEGDVEYRPALLFNNRTNKLECSVYQSWDNHSGHPFPMPSDISQLWDIFHTVFETDTDSPFREILEAREPLHIVDDAFKFMDLKYKLTKELLAILSHYDYPYVIHTNSDLVSYNTYTRLLRPDLATVKMYLLSVSPIVSKDQEPCCPSPMRRLKAVKRLRQHNIPVNWVREAI